MLPKQNMVILNDRNLSVVGFSLKTIGGIIINMEAEFVTPKWWAALSDLNFSKRRADTT